jgi:pyruvate dehydrogenase E1 component alpha subunit
MEVYLQTEKFARACRQGKGPFLIEAVTFRQSGHHVNDPGLYLPKDKIDFFREHDPLKLGRNYMYREGYTDDDIFKIEEQVNREIQDAIEFARNSDEMSESEFLKFVEEY